MQVTVTTYITVGDGNTYRVSVTYDLDANMPENADLAVRELGDDEKERLARLFGKDKDSINVNNGVLNTIVPYFPNEPARHKLLDFMGDIYLVGMPVKGHFTIKCPGHRANVALAQQIRKTIINN